MEDEKRILDELKELADGKGAAWSHGNLRVTVATESKVRRLDRKKLFEENPQLSESDYMVTSKVAPRVRITENKKESK